METNPFSVTMIWSTRYNQCMDSKIDGAREKYMPNEIKTLFVAEAKPDAEERFFYYPEVDDKDFLYIYLMKALYADARDKDAVTVRNEKSYYLDRFMADGYYLVDAVDKIEATMKSSARKRLIKRNTKAKTAEIKELIKNHGTKNTRIVLIKATVYDGLYKTLSEACPDSVVDARIPFPSSGRQKQFLSQMALALGEPAHGWGF